MCAVLMNLEKATEAELREAINRKFRKFGGLSNMPLDTQKLVMAGQNELEKRKQ